MDSIERVEAAITMVEEARGVPLSASCVIHRGELLEVLDQIKGSLPADFQEALRIIRDRDEILESAQTSADKLVALAREEVSAMVSQTEIVAAARREAQRILDEVEAEANQARDDVAAYIDSQLATLEVILSKTLDVVSRGRGRLEGVDAKHVLSELSES